MKQQKYSPWLIVFRVLFTLLTAVLIVFIFERSLQNGAISAQESQRMLLAMQRVLAKFTDRELSLHWLDFSGVCSGVFAALLVLTFFHMMKWFILHDMEG